MFTIWSQELEWGFPSHEKIEMETENATLTGSRTKENTDIASLLRIAQKQTIDFAIDRICNIVIILIVQKLLNPMIWSGSACEDQEAWWRQPQNKVETGRNKLREREREGT